MAERLYERGGTDTEAFIPAPANPVGDWAPKPYGDQVIAPVGLPRQNMASDNVVTPPPAPVAPAPANPNSALAQSVARIAGSAASGFGAGSQVMPTPDATDAALQVGGAVLSGAGTGFIASGGNPIGAVVGGVVGLVSGGLNAYMGTRRARAARRQQERQLTEIRKMQKEEKEEGRLLDARNRADTLEEKRYQRNLTRVQSVWTAHNAALSRVNDLMKTNAEFRDSFIRGGR